MPAMTRLRTLLPALFFLGFLGAGSSAEAAKEKPCFESRKDASEVTPHMTSSGQASVKCSPKTRAVLWWSDPFKDTVPMGHVPTLGDKSDEKAVVRPRESSLSMIEACGVECHEGTNPPLPKDKNPRALGMHDDLVPDALHLQHGRGAIWCLDCHHATIRNKLIDNFGKPVSFNEPQKLCGKCHGQVYRDWRDGIHGKRIGEWASDGKKRWFVCTECHDPHNVQQGTRGGGFAQLEPEPAPALPKGLKNADHERQHEHAAATDADAGPLEQLVRWITRAAAKLSGRRGATTEAAPGAGG